MSDNPVTPTTDAPGPAGAVREAIWVAIHGAVGFGGNHAVEITQATVAVIEQLETLGIDLRQEQEEGMVPDLVAEIERLRAALAQIAGPIKPDKHGTPLHERMRQVAREALS